MQSCGECKNSCSRQAPEASQSSSLAEDLHLACILPRVMLPVNHPWQNIAASADDIPCQAQGPSLCRHAWCHVSYTGQPCPLLMWAAGVSESRLQDVVISLDKVKLCLRQPGQSVGHLLLLPNGAQTFSRCHSMSTQQPKCPSSGLLNMPVSVLFQLISSAGSS